MIDYTPLIGLNGLQFLVLILALLGIGAGIGIVLQMVVGKNK